MAKTSKNEFKAANEREGGSPQRKKETTEKSRKEAFLSEVETKLVDYLKKLGSLPSQTTKKDDPITQILESHVRKWREVRNE